MSAGNLIPSYEPYSHLVIMGAEGNYVHTQMGRLLDLNGGAYWTTILGHGDAGVRQAMSRGFSADLFGFMHAPAIRLASTLTALTGFARVSFSTSGSDAVDAAIRMTYQYHRSADRRESKRQSFITLKNGFHGTTLATLTTSGFQTRREILPSVGSHYVFGPWVVDPSIDSLERAQELLREEFVDQVRLWPSIGGFLFEPIQGVGGIRAINPYCYRAIAGRCREYGVLIIADEVSTGIGRTGRILATDEFEPRPDIVTIGKTITNGEFPLAATLVTREVWQKLDSVSEDPLEKYLFGSCYAGHPTGCLAAHEVLERMNTGMLMDIRAKGEKIRTLLDAFQARHEDVVNDVRGVGLMWGIEFPDRQICHQIRDQLMRRFVWCGTEGRVLTVFPSAAMDPDEVIGTLTRVLDEILCAFQGG